MRTAQSRRSSPTRIAAVLPVEPAIRCGCGNRVTSLSVESLIRTYQHDVEKKQVLLRKATATRNELMFITEALRKLLNDENFVTLLRAEALATLPKNLSDRLAARTGDI